MLNPVERREGSFEFFNFKTLLLHKEAKPGQTILVPYMQFSLYGFKVCFVGRILLHAQWSAEMRNQWDSIWLFGTITSRTINILFTQSLRCLFIIVHGTPSTYTLRFCASLSWFDRATAPLLKLLFTIFF